MTREEALAQLRNGPGINEDVSEEYNEAVDMAIEALEQEPKTGHWVTKPHVYGATYCSECDFELKIDDTNYCPNCGAKMTDHKKVRIRNNAISH